MIYIQCNTITNLNHKIVFTLCLLVKYLIVRVVLYSKSLLIVKINIVYILII